MHVNCLSMLLESQDSAVRSFFSSDSSTCAELDAAAAMSVSHVVVAVAVAAAALPAVPAARFLRPSSAKSPLLRLARWAAGVPVATAALPGRCTWLCPALPSPAPPAAGAGTFCADLSGL